MKKLVVEHKTSSEDISPGSKYWSRLAFDPQIALYLNSDQSIDGVLYDVVRKILLRPRANEIPKDFLSRCLDDIAKNPTTYFVRQPLVRFEEEQTNSMRDMWQTARLISLSKKGDLWPRNANSCTNYNYTCEYHGVCRGELDINDALLFRDSEPLLGADVLSVSGAKAYAACPRKYQYAYLLRRRPVGSSKAQSFGKLFHRALEKWWGTRGDLECALRVLEPPADHLDCVKAEALLRGYHARWADVPMDVEAVEASFTTNLIDPDTGEKSKEFRLGGVVDAVARM